MSNSKPSDLDLAISFATLPAMIYGIMTHTNFAANKPGALIATFGILGTGWTVHVIAKYILE